MLDYASKHPHGHFRRDRPALSALRRAAWWAIGVVVVLGTLFAWMGMPLIQVLWEMIFPPTVNTFWGPTQPRRPWGMFALIGLMAVGALVLAQIVLSLLSTGLQRLRTRRAQLVMAHLSTAIQLRLPIPPYLRGAAQAESRSVRRRCLRLANEIGNGLSIGTALYLSNPEVGPRAIAMVDAGEATGTLDEIIAQLATETPAPAPENRGGNSITYVVTLSSVLLIVVSFASIFVMPKFRELFEPPRRQPGVAWMPGITGPSDGQMLLLSLLSVPLLAIAIAIAARNARGIFSARPTVRLSRVLTDPIVWRLPMLGRLTRAAAYRDVTSVASTAVSHGQPLVAAVRAAMMPHLNRVLLARLRDLHDRLVRGQSPSDAARAAGLPDLIASPLASPGNLSKALSFASQVYASQHARSLVLLESLVPVATTAFFAVCVAMIGLSIFRPITRLIEMNIERIYPS